MSDDPGPAPEPAAPADPTAYEARLEAVLEGITDGFYALDADWRYVIFNRAAEAYFGVSRDQVLGRTMEEVFPQGRGTYFELRMKAAMDQGETSCFEIGSRLRPDRTLDLRISPMRGGGVAVVLTDITERRAAEERRRLLVNELNHRVKNTLATVQAIAAQSLQDVPPDVRARFIERLMALARANDVLVAEEWAGATISAIAAQVASPYAADPKARRFVVDGPELRVAPKPAVALALALHELATNAAKYGALSAPQGRVDLRWSIDDRFFRLTWREAGGPPVVQPDHAGFGARLIRRGLSLELQAEVTLDYAADGLVCTVTAPLSAVVQAD
jgi:PAS domain S-box-containing protein